MQARFAAGIGFAVKVLRHGGWTAHSADEQNLDLKDPALIFNAQLVAGANLAGGLGAEAVRLNAAHVAGARGHGARFEEARGPKPLVDAHGRHLKGGPQLQCVARGVARPSGRLLDLPDVQEFRIARSCHLDAFLMRGAVQRGPDVFL